MIARGDVYWADLPSPRQSEPGRRRPVVVIQANPFNRSRLATVIVAAMTTNLRLGAVPGNVFCPPQDSGLPQDSVINISQLVTMDRTFLDENRAGALPDSVMAKVADGLRLILGL